MMMRHLSLAVLAVLLALTSIGCDEANFLEVTNENELNSENYFDNVGHFQMALNGVYSAVKSLDLYGQNFYVQTLLALPHESDYWNAQSRNDVSSDDGNVYVAWRGWYRVVARANDLIANAPSFIEEQNPTPAQKDELDLIVAQARFLRAFAYFHIVRLWGEDSYPDSPSALAAPLILQVPGTRADMMKPRATVGEMYDQILADFKAAEEALPPSWDAANAARVDKYAAKGFLGKVYLYMEEYAAAKPYFEAIINNPSYDLVPHEEYDALFHGENEFSEESIWEINYTIDMAQNIWENGLGSGIGLSLAPPGRGWSNVTPHGVNIYRFGEDPRLNIAIIAPTDSAANVDGVMVPAGESEFNYTGHSFRKYVPVDYSVYSTNRNTGMNFIVMRLADVYLMYAEVLNHLGQDNLALEYVNKVRRRAYGFNPHVARASVDLAGLSGAQLRDTIREERFMELFAEGHRWYDIVRWEIVEDEILRYNEYRVTQGPITFEPRDYYYPIPLSEVDSNDNMTPSTGY